MRRARAIAGACLVSLAASLATAAQASTDDLVARAMVLVRDGHAAAAYALLHDATDARADDADFDYTLGLAAIDSGHPAEGIVALQRALALQPGNAEARAEIARAYARLGDMESARAQFDTVLADPTIPDPVRQRFTSIVRDLDSARRGGERRVSGFVEASGGYDSNINTATALTAITLPVFAALGPASLSGAAVSQDSAFLGVDGGLSLKLPLSAQTAVYASALGDARFNTRTPAFDQVLATGTAGIAHTRANHDVASLSGQYQAFWLDGDHYRNAYGAIAQYTHLLQGGRALSFGGQFYRLDYPTDRLRQANRFSGSVSYAGRVAAVTASAGIEDTTRAGSENLSNTFVALRASVEQPLAARVALVGSLGAEGRFHHADDPLFLTRRTDAQFDASLGLRLEVARGIYVRPGASYARNFSNIALYDYRRFTASLAVRAEF